MIQMFAVLLVLAPLSAGVVTVEDIRVIIREEIELKLAGLNEKLTRQDIIIANLQVWAELKVKLYCSGDDIINKH